MTVAQRITAVLLLFVFSLSSLEALSNSRRLINTSSEDTATNRTGDKPQIVATQLAWIWTPYQERLSVYIVACAGSEPTPAFLKERFMAAYTLKKTGRYYGKGSHSGVFVRRLVNKENPKSGLLGMDFDEIEKVTGSNKNTVTLILSGHDGKVLTHTGLYDGSERLEIGWGQFDSGKKPAVHGGKTLDHTGTYDQPWPRGQDKTLMIVGDHEFEEDRKRLPQCDISFEAQEDFNAVDPVSSEKPRTDDVSEPDEAQSGTTERKKGTPNSKKTTWLTNDTHGHDLALYMVKEREVKYNSFEPIIDTSRPWATLAGIISDLVQDYLLESLGLGSGPRVTKNECMLRQFQYMKLSESEFFWVGRQDEKAHVTMVTDRGEWMLPTKTFNGKDDLAFVFRTYNGTPQLCIAKRGTRVQEPHDCVDFNRILDKSEAQAEADKRIEDGTEVTEWS